MEGNGGSETAEVYIRGYFGGGKGAVTGIRKVWKGRGMGGGNGI